MFKKFILSVLIILFSVNSYAYMGLSKKTERGVPETPIELISLPDNVLQAVYVEHLPDELFKVRVMQWVKDGGQWRPASQLPLKGVVGRNGIARLGEKLEGDGKTPSGIYGLSQAFGYSLEVQTRLDYKPVTENDFWVDDPESPQYNQWVTGAPQAKSFERLHRDDDLYKLAIVVDYNTNPIVPGKGSAIFVHIWRSPDTPTAGCLAMSEESLVKLLQWLNKSKNPVIIFAGY